MQESTTVILTVLAGFLAGGINTLAGNGSAITLALLTSLGIPANIANGTNRIGVLFQSFTGWRTFYANGIWDAKIAKWLIPLITVFALIGSAVAIKVPVKLWDPILGCLMVFLLILTLLKPKRWLQTQALEGSDKPGWKQILVFAGVGFYGGFIQAGVGVLMLASMVLMLGIDLRLSNGLKIGIVALYSIPVFLLFWFNGQVNWYLGMWLAVGQTFGAWLAARFAVNSPNASIWIRRLMIAVLIFGIVKFFHLYSYITS